MDLGKRPVGLRDVLQHVRAQDNVEAAAANTHRLKVGRHNSRLRRTRIVARDVSAPATHELLVVNSESRARLGEDCVLGRRVSASL